MVKLNNYENGYKDAVEYLSNVGIDTHWIKDSIILSVELNSESELTTYDAEWMNVAGLNDSGLTISCSMNKDVPVKFIFIPMNNISSMSPIRDK